MGRDATANSRRSRSAGTGRPAILDHRPRHRCVVEPPAAERTPHRNDLVARVRKDLAVIGTYLVPQVGLQFPIEQKNFLHFPEQLPCLVDGLEYGLAEFGWQHAVLALNLHQTRDRLVGHILEFPPVQPLRLVVQPPVPQRLDQGLAVLFERAVEDTVAMLLWFFEETASRVEERHHRADERQRLPSAELPYQPL